jgi:ATP phosphoribosyltransferase
VTNVIWSVQEREKWNPISSKKKKKIPTEYPLMQKTYFAFKRDKAASKDTRPYNHA